MSLTQQAILAALNFFDNQTLYNLVATSKIFGVGALQILAIRKVNNLKLALKPDHLSEINWYRMILSNVKAIQKNQKLIKLKMTHFGWTPLTSDLNWLAKKGELKTLKFFSELNLYPDQTGLEKAIIKGHLKTVKFLLNYHNIKPDLWVYNEAAKNGHLTMLKWLAKKNGKYPNIKYAVKGNYLNIVKWLLKETDQRLTICDISVLLVHSNEKVLFKLFQKHQIDFTKDHVYQSLKYYKKKIFFWLILEKNMIIDVWTERLIEKREMTNLVTRMLLMDREKMNLKMLYKFIK